MEGPGNISIADFHYDLPQERIAQYPSAQRDQSRLLIYDRGGIRSDRFRNLAGYLPEGGRLIFNETRVIPARIMIHKPTGAKVEIFCLEPFGPVRDYQMAFQQGPGCEWKCFVGNARRWTAPEITASAEYRGETVKLLARKVSREKDHFIIRFDWKPERLSFLKILDIFGKLPLPPYIRREADTADQDRYQTMFARQKGSIAAPTAGLHFTAAVMDDLAGRNIATAAINLHVGAGTFKPVNSDRLAGHAMHTEYIRVSRELICDLLREPDRKTILVGTTTVRTMESLYWQGVKWLEKRPENPVLDVEQWDPYPNNIEKLPSRKEALQTLLGVMDEHHQDFISGFTSLLIAPGYPYRFPDAMITNFHLPQSTLLLLVAAFIGDEWKLVYRYALDNGFRFLSYGDSCLFLR